MSDRRERIPVERARQLYDQLGTWAAVARVLKRKSGQPFTSTAIAAAVRWDDLGNVGCRRPQITSMREIIDRLDAKLARTA